MTYRCLIHIPTKNYCGQIDGEISDWAGLAARAEDWAISCVDDSALTGETVDLGHGCVIRCDDLRPAPIMIGGDE